MILKNKLFVIANFTHNFLFMPGILQKWSHSVVLEDLHQNLNDDLEGKVVDIFLHRKNVFVKQKNLPYKAKKKISSILELDVKQSLPNSGQDVSWSYETSIEAHKEIKVNLYFIKKEALKQIVKQAHQKNIRLRTISIYAVKLNHPLIDNRRATDKPLRFWLYTFWICFTCFVAGIYINEKKLEEKLSIRLKDLEQYKTSLESRINKQKQDLEKETQSYKKTLDSTNKFKSEFHRLPIFIDLTDALSDQTWLSDLSVQEDAVYLSGLTSQNVTDLIKKIQTYIWVEDVQLQGSILFDSFSQKNRFDLLIEIRSNELIE